MMGMAEVENDLLYGVSKPVQAGLPNMVIKQSEVDNRLASISGQLPALAPDVNAAHGEMASIYKSLGRMDGRLTRIAKRLDIIDEPAE
jgi:hypothetical protein